LAGFWPAYPLKDRRGNHVDGSKRKTRDESWMILVNCEKSGSLYYQFPTLFHHGGLIHGVFTRQGGLSHPPYESLNVSYVTGDDPAFVRRNLEIVKKAMGAHCLIFMNQVHGKDILAFHQDSGAHIKNSINADAAITNMTHLALMVKQADCQAVILFDPQKRVVSNVHCGWRGQTQNILGSAVRKMRSDFGCRASDMMAAIGPSLGPCCAEFTSHMEIFPEKFRQFMIRDNFFNLWEISRWQLLDAGIKEANIEVAGICTRCKTDLFYSYRAEGVTGRFGTVVMLK